MTLSFHLTHLLFWGLTAEESLFGPFLLPCSPQNGTCAFWGKKHALQCATFSTSLYSHQENGVKSYSNPVFPFEITNSLV